MNPDEEYIFRCIRLSGLNKMYKEYSPILGENFNTHELCSHIKEHKVYLADKYNEFVGMPEKLQLSETLYDFVAISYTWTTPLKTVLKILNYYAEDKNSISSSAYCWLDIVLVDQNARDVLKELGRIPEIYSKAKCHFIIGYICYTRGWCQFELSLSGTRYMNLANLPEQEFALLSSSPLLMMCPLATERKTWDLYNSVIVPMTQGLPPKMDLTPDEGAILETIMDASFTKAAFSFESDRSFVEKKIEEMYGSGPFYDDFSAEIFMKKFKSGKMHIGRFDTLMISAVNASAASTLTKAEDIEKYFAFLNQ